MFGFMDDDDKIMTCAGVMPYQFVEPVSRQVREHIEQLCLQQYGVPVGQTLVALDVEFKYDVDAIKSLVCLVERQYAEALNALCRCDAAVV